MWSYPLTSSSTEVKNEWSYISIPPHAFTGCTGTPLPWNTMEQEINYPQRRQYYYDETESIFIRTMDQVVSQWGTDVTTILPPPPLHSGIESIQKGNVMFYHFFFFFPICCFGLYHPLFRHCCFMSFGYDLCAVIIFRFYECILSMPQTMDSVQHNTSILTMQKDVRI